MKVLFLTKKRDACWYFRVLIPMSYMNINGHECKDELLEHSVQYCEHCKNRFLVEIQYDEAEDVVNCHLCGKPITESLSTWKQSIQDLVSWADVVVMQRVSDAAHLKLLKEIQSSGKKVGLEFDDNYFEVPETNPGREYYFHRREVLADLMKQADFITVTTVPLKERYLEFNQNIYVLPNSLDIEMFDLTPKAEMYKVFAKITKTQKKMVKGEMLVQKGAELVPMMNTEFEKIREGKIVIGWGGSPTHEDDLAIVIDACSRVAKQNQNVIFLFFGYVHNAFLSKIPDGQLFMVCLAPVSYYFNMMKALRYDIGLAPVKENLFNAAKSNLKTIEYFQQRTIPVASNFTTYNSSINKGFLAENAEWSWHSQLRKAINLSEEEKNRILDENRKYVEENFNMKHNWKLWVQVLERFV